MPCTLAHAQSIWHDLQLEIIAPQHFHRCGYSCPDASKREYQSFAQDADTIKCECLFTDVPARIFLNIYHSSLCVKVISLPLALSDDS